MEPLNTFEVERIIPRITAYMASGEMTVDEVRGKLLETGIVVSRPRLMFILFCMDLYGFCSFCDDDRVIPNNQLYGAEVHV